MVQVGHRGEGVGEGVDEAQPLLERDRAHHGGHQHRAPRLQVTRRLDAARQGARGEPQALESDPVADRVVVAGEVGLDAVRQRVHAGRGRHLLRQADGDLGVGEHGAGQELRREDDLLHPRAVVGDDRAAADLAAGAGGGRHGDPVRHRLVEGARVGPAVFVVEQLARMPGHERHRLGHVQGGSPAHADEAVGPVRAEGLDPGPHLGCDGVSPHSREGRGLQAAERGQHLGEERQRRHPAVGDDEGAAKPVRLQVLAHAKAGAGPEVDEGREAEGVDGHRFIHLGGASGAPPRPPLAPRE